MKTTKKEALTHWRNGRESRACDGSTANPAFATRDILQVTCPTCIRLAAPGHMTVKDAEMRASVKKAKELLLSAYTLLGGNEEIGNDPNGRICDALDDMERAVRVLESGKAVPSK